MTFDQNEDSSQVKIAGSALALTLIKEMLPVYLAEAGLPWRFDTEVLGTLSFCLDYGGGVTLLVDLTSARNVHETGVAAQFIALESSDQTRMAIHKTRQILCPVFVEFGLYDEEELKRHGRPFNPRQMTVLNLLVRKYRKRGELQWNTENAITQYDQTKYTITPDGNYSKS